MSVVTYKLTLNRCKAFYIGSSISFKGRLLSHLSGLRRGQHDNYKLQEAWNDSGSDGVLIEILFRGSIAEAQAVEAKLLLENSDNPLLMNICVQSLKGVDYDRVKDPDALRIKKSLSVSGEKNPMFGVDRKELMRRVGLARRGTPSPLRGRTLKLETIEKIKASKRLNPAVGSKNPFFGRKHSDETKARLRITSAGKMPPNAMRTVISGVEYKSQAEAARALGIDGPLIAYRLKRPDKYPNYKTFPQTPSS